MKSPHVFASVRFALAGLRHAVLAERNVQIHVALTVVAVAVGWWLGLAPSEWAVLALTIGLVLVAELANTAIERLVDLVAPDRHPLAGAAKDVAAGAVLVSAGVAVVVALLLFGPKVVAWLGC